MTKNNRQAWFPLIVCLAIIAGIFLGFFLKSSIPGKNFFTIEKASPLEEIISLVRNKYVDTVDLNAINDSAIAAVLARLDPHSAYIPAKELQAINDEMKGSFFGIGVEYNVINDTLHIINVLDDGPAAAAGLKIGDRILKAADSTISGVKRSTTSIRNILTGEMGSEVKVDFIRNGNKKTLTVTRGIIPIRSVDASYMITPTIGFIRLNRFSTQTYSEFMTSLTALKKEGMTKMILDLRDNGGGVLDEAVEIADEFLAGDKLITYTEGVNSARKEYRCRREGQFEKGALVVLCNEGTASASEILMGALQDWDRATIIGHTSFGKGLVQEQYMLSDKSALRLTIARYYTPLGRSIQRSYKNGTKAYYADALQRMEGLNVDTLKKDSSKAFKSSSGKLLFGGDGIEPDVYVAGDSIQVSAITRSLVLKGIVNEYGYRYFLQNPGLIDKYKKPSGFVQQYLETEDNWLLFQSLAAQDSIDVSRVSDAEKKYLQKALKVSLARQLYRNEGMYEAANADDATVKKALEILR